MRRIAGAETQESFVGSDFTYEDIGGREFDEYTYTFAGLRRAQGTARSWTPPAGGRPQPAWRLESRRKDANAEFPRVISLVLKDSFIVVAADIFNRRNEKQKIYTVTRRADRGHLDGHGVRDDERHREDPHRAVVESIDYNVGLKESDFSRRELERGAGKMSRALAGVIYRWRFLLSGLIVLGALALAPRATSPNRQRHHRLVLEGGSGLSRL